jgi:Flp pilus assembly protein CpaB
VSPSSIVLTVRARRTLARPLVRRVCVGGLAVATALTVVALVGAAGTARDRWGRSRPVVVATRDLAPGEVVAGADVEVRDLPEGVLPEDVLEGVLDGGPTAPPTGAVVRQPILAGEPIVATRLAPQGLTGAAALVPPGERAVAVPLGPSGAPPVTVGDLVDVLTVLPAGLDAGDEEPAFPLVERAAVVDVTEAAITVAVPERDAPRVAWALSNGAVVLALAGG